MRMRHNHSGSRAGARGLVRALAVLTLTGAAMLGLGVTGASAAGSVHPDLGAPTCIWLAP